MGRWGGSATPGHDLGKRDPHGCFRQVSWEAPLSPHHPWAELLTRSPSVLQPSPASSGTGSRPAERRRPLVGLGLPPGEWHWGETGGEIPGVETVPPPQECWTANAPRPPSPSFLSAAKPPSGCKTLEPVPTPSAHQPCGSLPAPHHDWLSVRTGECASGRLSVPESCAPSVACPADAGACAGPGPPLLGRVRRINYLSEAPVPDLVPSVAQQPAAWCSFHNPTVEPGAKDRAAPA